MSEGAIECYKLDVTCDVPEELFRLQSENTALNRKTAFLKLTITLLGAGIGIYIISKIATNGRKEKEKRTRPVEGRIVSAAYREFFQ